MGISNYQQNILAGMVRRPDPRTTLKVPDRVNYLTLVKDVQQILGKSKVDQDPSYESIAKVLSADESVTALDVIEMHDKTNSVLGDETKQFLDILTKLVSSYLEKLGESADNFKLTKEDYEYLMQQYKECPSIGLPGKAPGFANIFTRYFDEKMKIDNTLDIGKTDPGDIFDFDEGDSGDSDSGSASGNGVGTVTVDPQDIIAVQNKILLMRAKVQDLI